MRAAVRTMALLLLLAAACTTGGERSAGAPRAVTIPGGGTLRVGVPDLGAVLEMDPQTAYNAEPWGLFRCCLLRTLYSYNGAPTEQGGAVPRPDLAAGPPEVSADGLTWTFELRDGLRYAPPFEDTPITSLDLVRALERTARLSSPRAGYGFYYFDIRGFEEYASGAADSIVGLEAPDDRTLIVRLDRETGDLAYRFSLPATAPIPEGAAEGHDEDYEGFVVASGPYMFEGSERIDFSAPPDEQEPAAGFAPAVLAEDGTVEEPGSIVLIRNPSWDQGTDRLRAAYADRIELTLGGDDQEIAGLVDGSEIDLAFGGGSSFEQVARYQGDPGLEDRLFVHPNDISFSVTMNLAMPPFDDVHVRRAVARAIDKTTLIELLSEPPYGPFGYSWGEVATHMAPDAFEGSLLRAFEPYPYDPAAALDEMRASAYDRTGDGRCDAHVCRNVRTLVIDAGAIPDQARAIRDDLAEVGIELDLRTVPPPAFFGDPDPSGSIHDPRAHNAMGIAYPWAQDYPEGAGWFGALFGRPGLEGSNTSLLGATPRELREWGYEVTSVPSVDDRIQVCLERRGVARTQCWAEFDQYLTTEVVSRVPYILTEHAQVVSERVVAYSFDQFSGLPALDRIALVPGSE